MRDFNKNRGFGGGSGRRGGFGKDSGRARMYEATCSDCHRSCEVPFKPMHGKPVYCNDCFRKDGDADSNRAGRQNFGRPDFRDRDRGDRQMYEAMCAECEEKCEVPFRPTGEKPVYCRDCFGKSNRGSSGLSLKKPEPSNAQLDQLNAKLDKILKALEIIMQKREFIVERPETKKTPIKKATKTPKPKSKKG